MSTGRDGVSAATRHAAVMAAAARVRDTAAAAEAIAHGAPTSPERNLAARDAHEAAKEEYAKLLRADEDFAAKSRDAERRLETGPPWDDEFSPSKLLEETDRAQS